MDVFRDDGHLTSAVLEALARGDELPDLTRLEISEHLAYCDICLQRYTDALAGKELLVPERSCQETLWRRVRMRSLQLLTSRYATAAAAVVLALTVVWGSRGVALPPPVPSAEEPSWTESCNAALDQARQKIDDFFNRLEEARPD